jgi:hypothetical protein
MKTFIRSAFFTNLIIVIIFTVMSMISYLAGVLITQMFFGICAFIFLIILPSCSTKN